MDSIMCPRCDDAPVRDEKALCATCAEETNRDDALHAESRLAEIRSMAFDLVVFTEAHGVLCPCDVCGARRALCSAYSDIQRPGWMASPAAAVR